MDWFTKTLRDHDHATQLDASRRNAHQVHGANSKARTVVHQRPTEINQLDLHIADGGITSSGLELPSHLQIAKRASNDNNVDLVQENGYLHQGLIFHKEFRNAMLEFHSETIEASRILQDTVKKL